MSEPPYGMIDEGRSDEHLMRWKDEEPSAHKHKPAWTHQQELTDDAYEKKLTKAGHRNAHLKKKRHKVTESKGTLWGKKHSPP